LVLTTKFVVYALENYIEDLSKALDRLNYEYA